jgi:hypothetical protein
MDYQVVRKLIISLSCYSHFLRGLGLIILTIITQTISAQEVYFADIDTTDVAYGGELLFDRDVVYTSGFSLPENLPFKDSVYGYWNYAYGIESDGTIHLVNSLGVVVDTIDIPGLDWDITNDSLGIPLNTLALLDFGWTGSTTDTAFTNYDVPPCMVYENIDYDSTIYFKISDRVLNTDSSELYPTRIKEIAIYSSATDANDYFDVPEITAGALWIDPINGVDATGDGSYALPWKTIIGVEAKTITAGTQIYIKSGYELFADRWTATKNLKWRAVGFTKVRSTNATFSITCNSANATIEGLYVDATSKDNGFYIASGGAALINRCYINKGTYGINFAGIVTNITNSVISGSTYGIYNQKATGTLDISGCYNSSANTDFVSFTASTDMTINYKYNIDKKLLSFKGSYTAVNLIGNSLTSILATTGAYTGTMNIKHNTFTAIATGNIISSSSAHAERYVYDIYGNTFNVSNSYNCVCVYLVDQPTPNVSRNVMNISGATNTSSGIYINAVDQDCHPATVMYNSFVNASPNSGYALTLGNENVGAGDDFLNTSRIEGNHFVYSGAYGVANTVHGIFISRNSGCILRYNDVNGANIGIGFKSTNQDNVNAICANNILHNCQDPLLAKGFKNTKFYSNTILNDNSIWDLNGCQIIENTGYSTGCEFKNNIIVDLTDAEEILGNKQLIYVDANSNTDFVSNNNVLYSLNNRIGRIGTNYYTFAQWQALGNDADSYNSNPSLNTSLIPLITSDAIGNGDDLGATYDDGLDITTNWGNGITLPVVVKKQQPASWDIGAYIVGE